MPDEIVLYVTKYGYLAIFILVFLQETGFPNPFPNELLLIFSGYLSFKGLLYFPIVLATVISADFVGTNILYFLFYSAGAFIMEKKPRWIPLSKATIDRMTNKLSTGGLWNIYLFRLTPFTRGYASVITGLLQVKPKIFLPLALVSAATWAAFYITAGYIIGPSWEVFIRNADKFKFVMISILVLVVSFIIYSGRRERKRRA